MSRKLPYRLIESHTVYQGHHVRLVKDRFILNVATNKIVTRELLHHPGAVVILPFIKPGRILLLRQFRYAAKGDLREIPAGTLEKKEPPLTCAKRELEEETGYRARRWRYLTRFYPAPGMSDEIMTLYRADGLVLGRKNLDHDEWIEHEEVSFKKALQMVQKGRIEDAKSIAAILWAAQFG